MIQNDFINALLTRNRWNINLNLYLGADPNVGSDALDGKTPLGYAILLGQVEIVEDMVSFKANPDQKDSYGLTPLYYAVSTRNAKIVETILQKMSFFEDQQTNPNSLYSLMEVALAHPTLDIFNLLLTIWINTGNLAQNFINKHFDSTVGRAIELSDTESLRCYLTFPRVTFFMCCTIQGERALAIAKTIDNKEVLELLQVFRDADTPGSDKPIEVQQQPGLYYVAPNTSRKTPPSQAKEKIHVIDSDSDNRYTRQISDLNFVINDGSSCCVIL